MSLLRYTAAVAVLSLVPLAAPTTSHAAAGKKGVAAQKGESKAEQRTEAKDEASDQTLKNAITELQQVKNRVHGAAQIYGGHRGKADQHIDAAIAELQAALKYDTSRERTEERNERK